MVKRAWSKGEPRSGGISFYPQVTQQDCPTVIALLAEKNRIRDAAREYLESLMEEQLNTILEKRPQQWFSDLRSPAFILLHVITHTFHHKGQLVAMLRALGYPAPDTDMQRDAG
jgi:uncharacterized damage-inducible protein DinB